MNTPALIAGGTLATILVTATIISSLSSPDTSLPAHETVIKQGRLLTPQEAATAICQGAVDLGTPGIDPIYGCGRLDICEAFNKAATITANPVYVCATRVP